MICRISHIIHTRLSKFYLREDFIFRFSSLYNEQKNALKVLHGFADNVITERRKRHLSESSSSKDDFDQSLGQKRKMNLLDILLQSTINGEPLTDLDIREEVDTFMFGVFLIFAIAHHDRKIKIRFYTGFRHRVVRNIILYL